ncbi:hypothetical protein [Egbenema bharatensis]|uniref:hypothetical protein n=1 Tax=Egbenema bharatensis TaxID=3463334 RepID=UPI003A881ACA
MRHPLMKSRSRSFYPPQLNSSLVWAAQQIAPYVAHVVYRLDLMVSVEPDVALDHLSAERCLLLCNHPTFDDPIALFLLSGYLNQPFYYMAAREQFDSWKGWFYQQMGAYSVQRGFGRSPQHCANPGAIAGTPVQTGNFSRGRLFFPE